MNSYSCIISLIFCNWLGGNWQYILVFIAVCYFIAYLSWSIALKSTKKTFFADIKALYSKVYNDRLALNKMILLLESERELYNKFMIKCILPELGMDKREEFKSLINSNTEVFGIDLRNQLIKQIESIEDENSKKPTLKLLLNAN